MNPKRRKDISIMTAKQLMLPVEHVDDIISTYYSYTTKVLSSLKHPHVFISNLGVFSVNVKKIKRISDDIANYLNKSEEPLSMKEYEKNISLASTKQSYDRLIAISNDEMARKLAVRNKQKEYYENKCN